MELTPGEQEVIEFLRAKRIGHGKLSLIVHYQNWKIVTVGIEKEYETRVVKDSRESSKIGGD